jgi:hypothetical protein
LGTAGDDGDKLDGTEPELQVNSEHGYEKDNCHRQSEEWNKATKENGKAAENFDHNSEPCHKVGRWNGESVEGCSEGIGATGQLGEPVLHESETDDEPEREGCKNCEILLSPPECVSFAGRIW